MAQGLAYDLHVLISLLDRSADRILRAHFDIPYRRFLTLLTLADLGPATQRALADRLGTSEPSVSRMAGVLAQEGLLTVSAHPEGGNRRRLELTARGRQTVTSCAALLEEQFAGLVSSSGVSYDDYAAQTRRMLELLNRERQEGMTR